MPANTSVLNQLVISSFMSKATRYVCPDFSEVAEREMLKSNLSAVSNTLRLVRSETSSGRARDCRNRYSRGFGHLTNASLIHVGPFATCGIAAASVMDA